MLDTLDILNNDYLTQDEKVEYILGKHLYKELTEDGKKPISKTQSEKLKDYEIDAIVAYSFLTDIDFERNTVATESVGNIMSAAVGHSFSDVPIEEILKQFRAELESENHK